MAHLHFAAKHERRNRCGYQAARQETIPGTSAGGRGISGRLLVAASRQDAASEAGSGGDIREAAVDPAPLRDDAKRAGDDLDRLFQMLGLKSLDD